jgi:hypothetical protein
VGEVMWHSLDESGNIEVYDVRWPNGRVERNIPSRLIEAVKVKEHKHTVQEVNTPIKDRKHKQ